MSLWPRPVIYVILYNTTDVVSIELLISWALKVLPEYIAMKGMRSFGEYESPSVTRAREVCEILGLSWMLRVWASISVFSHPAYEYKSIRTPVFPCQTRGTTPGPKFPA